MLLPFSAIISSCEDHDLFMLILVTGVSCPLLKFFSSYQVLYHFSTGVLTEVVLPCSSLLTECFQLHLSPLYSFLEMV